MDRFAPVEPPSDERRPNRRVPPWADAALYAVVCGVATLVVARLFYAALKLQLFYSSVRGEPHLRVDDWSAPLDDVFIHFDFARAAARGYPFEWSEGNGYSSGGTSLLYPFVLALGYRVGFEGTRLMEFAAIVACTCVFLFLWLSRRLFRDLPAWTKYAVPVTCLGLGALDWSLFSGMEVAFFLAMAAVCLVAWDDFCRGEPREGAPRGTMGQAALLGASGAIVAATRPEGAVVVGLLSVAAAWITWRDHGARRALAVLVAAALPGALVVVAQSLANRLFTGESSAAGALVKLELHSPYLSLRKVVEAWGFHVGYQVARVTGYHVASNPWIGGLLWGFALLPLGSRRTRRYAGVLWILVLAWIFVVAFNGHVRWQNERYTMPAVAWILLCAALGLGAVLTSDRARGRRGRLQAAGVVGLTLVSGVALANAQVPRFRDQVWFFGRASRNIRDQHLRVGRLLGELHPPPRRVLVGDAGAIPYESDVPALDIIGLGGYRDLPFARAGRWGVAAAVELIERIPPEDRPDILAIYPTWWGDFPLWFGRPVTGVSVRGNVICGGLTKMVYLADWQALDGGVRPAFDAPGQVRDAVDVADIVDERSHAYVTVGAVGFVVMKLLDDPRPSRRTLWDAGRIVPANARAHFTLDGFEARRPARLVVRLAPSQPGTLRVEADGRELTPVAYPSRDGWVEVVVPIPEEAVGERIRFEVRPADGDVVLYHVWGLQGP
jgi:hypothetical protein